MSGYSENGEILYILLIFLLIDSLFIHLSLFFFYFFYKVKVTIHPSPITTIKGDRY